jgi:hypothetical protein
MHFTAAFRRGVCVHAECGVHLRGDGLDERWLGLCSARQGEVISDFMCETCAKKVDCNKRVCLDTMNNTIVLHLKVRAC